MTLLAPKDFVRSPELMGRTATEPEALHYTRWLATSHYENFHVVSFLLPKRLHQDFYNVYAYCRWADDLGDELGDKQESLRLLEWWREELHRMYAGDAQHPVFVALRQTVQKHAIPRQPFEDLITAFIHDQHVARYQTWHDVFAYCQNSANPVGRILLYLNGYADAERQALSDFTCTALQLANFWQDVTVDLLKDRVYMPLDVLGKHGYSVEDLFQQKFNPSFAAAMREMVEVARELFVKGLPLVQQVDRHLSLDFDLFSRGGLRVLDKIEQQGYNVLAQRPKISKVERAGILATSVARAMWKRSG
jgi:squalene synthase HpnC